MNAIVDTMPPPDRESAIMKVGIVVRGIRLAESIRHFARHRLSAALGRYRQVLQSVRMTLTDVNGPRGGVDKHCVIEVRVPALVPIVVRERDADLHVAIDRAADRVDRAVARRLARSIAYDSRSVRR